MANAALFNMLAAEAQAAIPTTNPITTVEREATLAQYTKVDMAGINPRAFPKRATKFCQDKLFNRINGHVQKFKNRNGFKDPLSFTMRHFLTAGNILVSAW